MKYKIKKSIQDGNFSYKAKSLILGKLLKLDHTQKVVAYRQLILHKLKRKYSKYVEYTSMVSQDPVKKVWVCWFQGLETSPLIVKRAIESIKEKFVDWDIVFLTNENLRQYANIPDIILEKWEKGQISHAHFSDILRINLLYTYGGLWVDATTYFTDFFPEYLLNTDLFYFTHQDRNDYALVMDSWLIYAKPKNPILHEVQKLLYLYWEKHKRLCEYFLVHLFFEIVLEKYPKEWEAIPYKNSVDAHILICRMNEKFSQEEFEFIKQQSFCHKLTYKLEVDNTRDDTFYKTLIEEVDV